MSQATTRPATSCGWEMCHRTDCVDCYPERARCPRCGGPAAVQRQPETAVECQPCARRFYLAA